MRSEIRYVIKKLKNRKSLLEDIITAEILKKPEEGGINALYMICNEVWHTGKYGWRKAVFILIHTKKKKYLHWNVQIIELYLYCLTQVKRCFT